MTEAILLKGTPSDLANCALVADEFAQAMRDQVGLRAVHIFVLPAIDSYPVAVLLASLALCQSRVGKLGVGKGAPQNIFVVRPSYRQAEAGVSRGNHSLVLGHVRKQVRRHHVAAGVDIGRGRLEALIHLYAVFVELDAGLFEGESFEVGLSADGDQDGFGFALALALLVFDISDDYVRVLRKTCRPRVCQYRDSLVPEDLGKHVGEFLVFFFEDSA
jgi:hypothetical protein